MRESRGNIYDDTLVIIGERKHTFPSRTRSLSSQPPMVVRPRCRARVGCCQSNGAGYPKGCPAPLVFGCPLARQRCECTNKGRLGKLLTHFADCSSASFNFYSAFLGGRCLAQFIVASLMSPDVQKDVGALFVCGCPLARQRGYVRTRDVWGSSLPTSRTARPLRSTLIVCS